jgi:hypothetical protein
MDPQNWISGYWAICLPTYSFSINLMNSLLLGDYMAVLRPSGNSNVIKIVASRKRRLSQDGHHHQQQHLGAAKEGRGEGSGRGRTRGGLASR